MVLDVDADDGGPESLTKLERGGFPVPRTARTRTGGGGIHVFFRYPSGTEIRNSAGLLGPGLDVRGEGGSMSSSATQEGRRSATALDCSVRGST